MAAKEESLKGNPRRSIPVDKGAIPIDISPDEGITASANQNMSTTVTQPGHSIGNKNANNANPPVREPAVSRKLVNLFQAILDKLAEQEVIGDPQKLILLQEFNDVVATWKARTEEVVPVSLPQEPLSAEDQTTIIDASCGTTLGHLEKASSHRDIPLEKGGIPRDVVLAEGVEAPGEQDLPTDAAQPDQPIGD